MLHAAANSHPLLRPGLLPWAIRLDRAPAWLWIALQTAALWPAWRQMAAHVTGGSGELAGLLALAAFGALPWLVRQRLRGTPRLPWLAAALAGTLGATLLHGLAAPLADGLLAAAAWACCLLAFVPAARRGAMIANTFHNRVLGKTLFGVVMLACALWGAHG